jgi:hypothetical protein
MMLLNQVTYIPYSICFTYFINWSLQALDSALKVVPGNCVPPGFVVLARELEGLRERLHTFASVRVLIIR